jgi:hypothetical protein
MKLHLAGEMGRRLFRFSFHAGEVGCMTDVYCDAQG